jgi:hypothetical protein
MSTSLGRFRIVGQNELIQPGCCIVCGGVQGEFIDFGFTLDYYGGIYFCVDGCFREAANAFEYYSPKQHRTVLNEVEFLRLENNTMKDQIEEMTRVFRTLTASIAATAVASVSDNVLAPSTESIDEGFEETKSRLDEQSDEQRRTDIQRDDSIDEFITDLDI